MGTDKMKLIHVYDKPFMVRFPDRSEWKNEFQPNREGGRIFYTDGSRTNRDTGAGVYGYGTTVFLAEVYAIIACVVENLGRNYRNRNIYSYILSDSQAASKALDTYQIK
jgi:hypothetical protein